MYQQNPQGGPNPDAGFNPGAGFNPEDAGGGSQDNVYNADYKVVDEDENK